LFYDAVCVFKDLIRENLREGLLTQLAGEHHFKLRGDFNTLNTSLQQQPVAISPNRRTRNFRIVELQIVSDRLFKAGFGNARLIHFCDFDRMSRTFQDLCDRGVNKPIKLACYWKLAPAGTHERIGHIQAMLDDPAAGPAANQVPLPEPAVDLAPSREISE
jgi:hypothetical protein